MSIFALIVGYIAYYLIYISSFNVFGATGFMLCLGAFLSHAVGAYLGAIVAGKIQFKKSGTIMNILIPLIFFMVVIGGIVGVIKNGWEVIWEYISSLLGLFIAFGFFSMRVDYAERRKEH